MATKKSIKSKEVKVDYAGIPKVLDTSVIIDGRILDIVKAGFIEGPLVVPVFVLEELQHIADSADALKRNRGRRGLDTVAEIQELKNVEVIIYKGKIEEIPEVDSKLLKLAIDLNGKIVTNDFNLNKVARVQNLDVLNINELANAVKPLYLPGEEMDILIVREGKEHNQGLAYLDDGTMIVVENGKDLIGEKVNVVVTSALQTSAGKMIFAKLKN
nr:PIN domain-containing protein [Peptoniphilus timonensis]